MTTFEISADVPDANREHMHHPWADLIIGGHAAVVTTVGSVGDTPADDIYELHLTLMDGRGILHRSVIDLKELAGRWAKAILEEDKT